MQLFVSSYVSFPAESPGMRTSGRVAVCARSILPAVLLRTRGSPHALGASPHLAQLVPDDVKFTTAEDEPCFLSDDRVVRCRFFSSLVSARASALPSREEALRPRGRPRSTACPQTAQVRVAKGAHVRIRIVGMRGGKEGLVRPFAPEASHL